MIIDSIQNGIVIDHISAGKAMELYRILGLDKLDCTVAILKNVTSGKLGRKDIIKIDREMELDWDLIGYVDPSITVNSIRDGQLVEKRTLKLPERIRGVLRCKNPRCITSVEQELPQEFVLTDREKRVYRCIYCETQAENKWYARGPTVAPWAFLRSPPSPASPSLFFLRRSVFRPFYFITIMYTLFESKTPIVRPYLLKSLFATGGGYGRISVAKCFGRSLPVGEPCDQDGYSEALKISCRQGTTGGRQNCSLWESIPAPP